MVKYLLTCLLIFCFATCCVMEPPVTAFYFKIINNSHTVITVDTEMRRTNGFLRDTLKEGQEFNCIEPNFCFKEYGDTLIQEFFKSLDIISSNGKIRTNPFQRSNWKDSICLEGIGKCKGGKVFYTFTIYPKDVK